MRLPTSFRVLGHTFEVQWDPLLFATHEAYGMAHSDMNVVALAPDAPTHPLSRSVAEHTFCHELVHVILGAMGRKELNSDEQFVDTFGGLLHQALTTGAESPELKPPK